MESIDIIQVLSFLTASHLKTTTLSYLQNLDQKILCNKIRNY